MKALLLFVFGKIITGILRKSLQKETVITTDTAKTPVYFIGRVMIAVVWIAIVFLILSGVKPLSGIGKAALGATSILAVIVGLAAQEAFGNFVAGFFLALYQPFRLGDIITLTGEGITGTVVELNMRHTVIRTYDGSYVVVPNSKMNSAIIENRRTGDKFPSREIVLSVAYDSDLDLVRDVIVKTVSSMPGFIDQRTPEEVAAGTPAVNVFFTDFLDSGIEVRFRIYAELPTKLYSYGSSVREALMIAFRENGITIPFPTRTVEVLH